MHGQSGQPAPLPLDREEGGPRSILRGRIEDMVEAFGKHFLFLFPCPPASVGLGVLLTVLCLGSWKEAPEGAFPQISSLPVSHFQGQNLEALVLFRHPQHRAETLPAHVPVDPHLKARPVQVEKFVALAVQPPLAPGFQFARGPRHDPRDLLGIVLLLQVLLRNPRRIPR